MLIGSFIIQHFLKLLLWIPYFPFRLAFLFNVLILLVKRFSLRVEWIRISLYNRGRIFGSILRILSDSFNSISGQNILYEFLMLRPNFEIAGFFDFYSIFLIILIMLVLLRMLVFLVSTLVVPVDPLLRLKRLIMG